MKISTLGLAVFYLLITSSRAAQNQEQCSKCDCHHIPMSDACLSCCSVATGEVESVSDDKVDLQTKAPNGKTQTRTFKITRETKKTGNVQRGALATIYFRRADNTIEHIEMVEAVGDLLTPGNEPDPPGPDCPVPPDALRIYYGSNLSFSERPEADLITYEGTSVVTLRKTNKGIALDLRDYDSEGKPSVIIINNHIYLAKSGSLHIDRSKPHIFVVQDERKNFMFSIEYLNQHAVRLLGTLQMPKSGPTLTVTQFIAKAGKSYFRLDCWEDGGLNLTPSMR